MATLGVLVTSQYSPAPNWAPREQASCLLEQSLGCSRQGCSRIGVWRCSVLHCTSQGSGMAPGSRAKCWAALGAFVEGRRHPSSQPRALQGWIVGLDGALGTPVGGHWCHSHLPSESRARGCSTQQLPAAAGIAPGEAVGRSRFSRGLFPAAGKR